jgi:predicted CXXCH cytochrome family protein
MQRFVIYFLIVSIAISSFYCNENKINENKQQSKFKNIHEGNFVGMQQCKNCHADKHETFMHTGMGLSFDSATAQKSSGIFKKHTIVFDSLNELYYHPFFKNDSMFITEFKLDGKDTIHKRTEFISYIIGSGQHTNSHMVLFNNYLYQAPITFYTQEKKWDLAPGFKEKNTRFSRIIEKECLSCHNYFPKTVEGSINKYEYIPKGIECERCHGNGSIHVKEKLAGKFIDTSKNNFDPSIVNPRHLDISAQNNLCERCHLQGITVLNDNKNQEDFKPGMHLNGVMNVFLPRYSDGENRFIMASQADRLRQSKCFNTKKISCITCHNPHISVKNTPIAQFNNVCTSCHNENKKNTCTENKSNQKENKKGCVGCHMQRSGSIDIPHISITDHNISKPIHNSEKEKIAQFLGLECVNNKNVNALEKARGYLAYIEKYNGNILYIDSVFHYLNIAKKHNLPTFDEYINAYFLQNNFKAILKFIAQNNTIQSEKSWTNYRIAESYNSEGDIQNTQKYFQKTVQKSPLNLDFQLKFANFLLQNNKANEAKKVYEFILKENNKTAEAHCNVSFIYLSNGDISRAEIHADSAMLLNPNYQQAMMNKVAVLISKKELKSALSLLNKILRFSPNNTKAKMVRAQILSTKRGI